MSSEETSQDAASSSFTGGNFVKAREDLGLSLEQLSRELHLPVATLEALERGEFAGLGGPVFVRGYIRAYARRLKMNPDTYVAQFDRQAGIKDTAASVRAVGTVSTSPARQSRSVMRFGTFVFIVAIIGIIVWWWQTQYSIDSVILSSDDAPVTVETADGNTLVLPPIDSEDAGSTQALPEFGEPVAGAEGDSLTGLSAAADSLAASAATGVALGLEEAASAADSALDTLSETGSALADAEPLPVVTPQLDLSLSDDSWLSVKDSAGKTLFNGIAKSGSDLSFEGEEPLSVVIGRASAVTSIQYAGEPVDLDQVSDKNVARLTLPASSR
ncbi:RodZ domain-containing protein [Marinobacterium sp. YM272]|uniref:RodZ domain-containing protein n=1 Tax=Marinobacterium sp. YM272 TaxID=3421654 RepID=UPI003D7FBAA8